MLITLAGCDQEETGSGKVASKPQVIAQGSLEPLVVKAWNLMDAKKYESAPALLTLSLRKLNQRRGGRKMDYSSFQR